MKNLKIAFLCSEGSPSSSRVLNHLILDHSISINTVFIEKASFDKVFKRTLSKFRRSGIVGTLRRCLDVLKVFYSAKQPSLAESASQAMAKQRRVYVKSFDDIPVLLQKEYFDIFIASTDSFLKRKVFDFPEYGTLNAHPAKNPEFRGLNSAHRMYAATRKRCITLHLIDEGVDTGPIILYREIKDSVDFTNLHLREKLYSFHQAAAFADGISLLTQEHKWFFIDSFKEPSNHY